MFRFFSGGMLKPRNLHSLEHLKYLYHVLSKNHLVHEQNKGLLVETLRSIAEILIWGDQNDSTVFDFFLEKNMLSFFLKIMRQKCGSYVCVQLLQTLNILFENIRNETSLYYLLSNNHVNCIIVHKFDFSDEEVMAYYISFLKTLSLKLNTHTIHFFYHEHTNDFPLYTEAIKFFNHSESMVRIAVRTLTLNVFRVDDRAMLQFIRDRTAAPYFFNLVWFIGNHVLELDSCVKDSDIQVHPKLADLVAEHLDHLHYLNDILCLHIDALNDVLTSHFLNRLLIPLYVYSLVQRRQPSFHQDERPHVSSIVSLFLLSQVFLIISHRPLVQQLAHIILSGDISLFTKGVSLSNGQSESGSEPEFVAPKMTLEKSLETTTITTSHSLGSVVGAECTRTSNANDDVSLHVDLINSQPPNPIPDPIVEEGTSSAKGEASNLMDGSNITDEEKAVAAQKFSLFESVQDSFSLSNRPFLETIFSALDCSECDHGALFSLCLLYALGHNPGINQGLLDTVLMPSDKSVTKIYYNAHLVEKLLKIIGLSCQYNSKVRLATLEMVILLLKQLSVKGRQSCLQDRHLAAIEQYREESSLMLRNFYKSEEIFLDMFEDEYEEMKKKPLNVEYLMMDAKLLLRPTGTPMSGIEFHKRLPCGEMERARRAIRFFFLLRDLSLCLQDQPETQLPLTTTYIKVNDLLDLNNGDLFYCTVVTRDGHKMKRFMVVDAFQLVLVESEPKRPGWGVAKFVGFLQDIEVTGDKDDSQCLHITVQRPSSKAAGNVRAPLLAAKFIFDDNIRCLAAKQSVSRGRRKARQRKLHQIAKLLDLPDHVQPCPSPLRRGGVKALREAERPSAMPRSMSQDAGLRGQSSSLLGGRSGHHGHSGVFGMSGKIPGYATKLKQEEIKHSSSSSSSSSEQGEKVSLKSERKRTSSSPLSSRRSSPRSRDSSPRQLPDTEEIPLEDLSKSRSSSRHNSPSIRRKSTSGLPQARISAPPGLCHIHHFSPSQSRTSVTSFERDGKSIPHSVTEESSSKQPRTLAASCALPASLVAEHSTLLSSPVILPPIPTSVNNANCNKPCCSSDQNCEKHDHTDEASSRILPPAQSEIENNSATNKDETKATIKGAIQTV